MITIEAIADVDGDGTLTVRASKPVPSGRHRMVIVIDDETIEASPPRSLSSQADFRASLGVATYPGSSVVGAREDERS